MQRQTRAGPGRAFLALALALLVIGCTYLLGLQGQILLSGSVQRQTSTTSATGSETTPAAVVAGAAAAAATATGSAAGRLSMGEAAAAAAAAVGLRRAVPALGPRSQRWAPLVLTACAPEMPRHSAPCQVGTAPGLVYAEELVYPPFTIPEPGFVNGSQAEVWRSRTQFMAGDHRYSLRPRTPEDRSVYRGHFPTQYGQTLVFKNITWRWVQLS